ncbi:MAG TPA: hypothetical protein PKJ41_05870 [Bryobacteraceae bacterium]|nr:hypothetical protein [Bryobacteraceae bacterium]
MSENVMDRLLPDSVGPSPEVEKAALRETQIALHERTTSTAIAFGAAGLVFACLPERAAWVVVGLRQGGVWLAAILCLVSLGLLWRFVRATMRLRALGIRRERGVRPRWSWEFAGIFVSIAVVSTVCAAVGWTLTYTAPGLLPGLVVATWLGLRLKQVPTYDEAQAEQRQVLSIKQDDDQGNG